MMNLVEHDEFSFEHVHPAARTAHRPPKWGMHQRLLFTTARLEHENELNIHEHAVFVNKEPGQLGTYTTVN